MSILGYDKKIIGGKLRSIPIYSTNDTTSKGSAAPHLHGGYGDGTKIGSKYSVIPPITGEWNEWEWKIRNEWMQWINKGMINSLLINE